MHACSLLSVRLARQITWRTTLVKWASGHVEVSRCPTILDRPRIRIVAGSPDRLGIESIAYSRTHDLELVGYAPTVSAFRALVATTPTDIVLVDAPAFGGVAVLQYPHRSFFAVNSAEVPHAPLPPE